MVTIIGASRFKVLSFSAKLILLLTGFSFTSELLANYFAIKYHNNYPIYNFYGLIEFVILSLYFIYSTDTLKTKIIPKVFVLLGFLSGVVNMFYIQSPYIFCSYFVLFEGFSILLMALYSFYRMLLADDTIQLRNEPDFWFKTVFFIYWSITYLTWPLYNVFDSRNIDTGIINNGLLIMGLLVYLVIGLVFLKYKKLINCGR